MKLPRILVLLSVVFSAPFLSGADPLVIARSGDPAPGLDGLTFLALSHPSLTEDNTRAAFVAQLDDNTKTYWFADLQDDGFYDIKLAASRGMPVLGLEPEDNGKVLDIRPFFGFGLGNTRNIPQIALDSIGGNLAFTAYLNDPVNVGLEGTGEEALFVATDEGVELVAKIGLIIPVAGIESGWLLQGFQDIQFINGRLVFLNSFDGLPDEGILAYVDGELTDLLLSPGIFPASIVDEQFNRIRA